MNYEQEFKKGKTRQFLWVFTYVPLLTGVIVLFEYLDIKAYPHHLWLMLLAVLLLALSMYIGMKNIKSSVHCISCDCNLYNNYLSCKNDGITLNYCPSCGERL